MNTFRSTPARTGRRLYLFLALDVVLIVLFAALGRDTHEHGLDPAGILLTASPFLAACLAGWALLARRHSPAALWPSGVALWLLTVVAGLGIRALAGGGVAPSFALVTLCVLGAFLLLPRAVAALLLRVRTAGAGSRAASASGSTSARLKDGA